MQEESLICDVCSKLVPDRKVCDACGDALCMEHRHDDEGIAFCFECFQVRQEEYQREEEFEDAT
jgi:hypothetical protein